MNELFGSSVYDPKGPQWINPKLEYNFLAGSKYSIEPVSKLTRR